MIRKTRVLATCSILNASAEIGVKAPLEKLALDGKIFFKFIESNRVTINDVIEADVVICIRGANLKELQIVNSSKNNNKYVIYFLDDNLLEVPNYALTHDFYNNSRQNIINMLRTVDCVWTTNSNLKNISLNYNSNTIVTNSASLLLNEGELYQAKGENNSTVIGFAGGWDHARFLDDLLDEPVKIILDRYKDKVQFEFFSAKPNLIDKYKLSYIPNVNSVQEFKIILSQRNWDIGLAPLPVSPFNSCKSYRKFQDYGSMKIAGIYSNCEPNTWIVKDKTNGILANNIKEEWINSIIFLIENKEVRNKIQENAYNELQNNFSLTYISKNIELNIPQIINYIS